MTTPSPAEAELSVLGVGTVLAAAEPQGAVVGTTAVLDGSTLAPQEEYARSLFADVAHQFTVRVYRGRSFSDRTLSDARAAATTGAPAHTTYHVCVVEPHLRVGTQARVGIDAIVGAEAAGTELGRRRRRRAGRSAASRPAGSASAASWDTSI